MENGPALALLELESIARGLKVADAVVKRAPVRILRAEAVTPGKYLLLFSGGVAEVQESLGAGREMAGGVLLDELLLSIAAPGLWQALRGEFSAGWDESVGVLETQSVASALLAADTALKRTDVRLKRLDLARGIGGKGVVTFTGSLTMVQTALEEASSRVGTPLLLAAEILERPHPELVGTVL